MKKISFLTLGLAALLFSSSCKKEKHEEIVIEQSMEKTLKANESVTFTLPASLSDDDYQITTAASHAYVSKLSEDLSGNTLYCYTPEKDYVGNDFVVVSTLEEEHHGEHGNHHGHPNGANKGGSGHCHGDKHPAEQQLKISIYLKIEAEVKSDLVPIKVIGGQN